MNYLNSFNVQGDPCIMGYNKIVVPFGEIEGIKAPVIFSVILRLVEEGGVVSITKEEFLQHFGGALPETPGTYLLVENQEDSVGIVSKWTENFLTETMLEAQLSMPMKVYTLSCEDLASITRIFPQLADDDITTLIALSTLGIIIMDFEGQILITTGLQIF